MIKLIPEWDDNPEWTAEDFARARPANEVLGPEFAAALVKPSIIGRASFYVPDSDCGGGEE